MSANIDVRNIALINTFYSGPKKYHFIFHDNQLILIDHSTAVETKVRMEDVISINLGSDTDKSKISLFSSNCQLNSTNNNVLKSPNTFVIHYAERVKEKLKHRKLHLYHQDNFQVASWVKTLHNYLHYNHIVNNRPRSILLFINPMGGRRNALKIFEKYAKHLFEIANVEVTVNISQRQYQIRDYVLNHNLEMFDAICVVGGDGTVSELFNGLVLRECRLQGIDSNDKTQDLPKPTLPIGIIPGGSTDTIVYCVNGTNDLTTAVLNIILGRRLSLDLVSVYDDNNLLCLYASILSYGFLGDVAYHSSQYRWMGPNRYSYSGIKALLENKGYEGEIEYLTDEVNNINEKSKCYQHCERCNNGAHLALMKNQWRTLKGNFFMICGANITCACSRSPNGMVPFCHLSDGNLYLFIVRQTSLVNNLKLLLRLSSKDSNIESISEDLPFVEIIRAQEFCFRAINEQSRWNCDGEVQNQVNIHAKVRTKLVDILATGCPRPIDQNSTNDYQKN